MSEINVFLIGDSSICVVLYRCEMFACSRNVLKDMIKQLFIFFLLQMRKKNSEDDSEDGDYLKEPHNLDDYVTVDGDFYFLIISKTIVHAAMIRWFLGVCDPLGVEPNDISKSNSQNSFEIGAVEDKENIEIFPTTNAKDEYFEVRVETA